VWRGTQGKGTEETSTSYLAWGDLGWSGWLFGAAPPVSDSASSSPRGTLPATDGAASRGGAQHVPPPPPPPPPPLLLPSLPGHSKLRASTRADGRLAQYGRAPSRLLNVRLSSQQWQTVAAAEQRVRERPGGGRAGRRSDVRFCRYRFAATDLNSKATWFGIQ
jgi:hypothetical protein